MLNLRGHKSLRDLFFISTILFRHGRFKLKESNVVLKIDKFQENEINMLKQF